MEDPEKILGQIQQEISGKIKAGMADQEAAKFFGALLAGGEVMASGILAGCEGVRKFWDKDREKNKNLLWLSTLAMLSECLSWINYDNPPVERLVAPLAQAFSIDTETAADEFHQLHTQLSYDRAYSPHMVHSGVILLAKACEAMGQYPLKWEKIELPVKTMEKLARSGAITNSEPLRSVTDNTNLWRAYESGVRAMADYSAGTGT